MNKTELARKIQTLDGLSNEEKTALLELIRGHKKYGLVWEEKPEDIEEQLREDLPVLTEVSDRAIISGNPEAPNHIIIEGDNLAALTELAYTHAGQIDVIYIDPPYNTGKKKEFRYNDDYVDSEDQYRHTKWLCFMKKRLQIAHSLLSNNGIIFISIDNNEIAQLKLLCDEEFGEKKLVEIIHRRKNRKPHNAGNTMSASYEFILAYYSVNSFKLAQEFSKMLTDEKGNYALYPVVKADKRVRTYTFKAGIYVEKPEALKKGIIHAGRNSNLDIEILDDPFIINGKLSNPIRVSARFCLTDERGLLSKAMDEGRIFFNINGYPKEKRYRTEKDYKIDNHHWDIEKGKNEDGDDEIKEIFSLTGENDIFKYPKPTALIRKILSVVPRKDIKVLDFFAGSGTTLQAVMQENYEDEGTRTCILCTNNENNICEEVTYERNKRVITGYTKPNGEYVEGLHDNNLRYYRTEFLPRERTAKNMRQLVEASTGLLCIKNDLYTEAPFGGRKMNPKYARYFDNGKRQMLAIYEERAIPFIVNIIKTLPESENKIKVYVFSHGSYAYTDEFADVAERVEPCALPQAIYDAYIKVLPKRKPKFLVDEIVTEIVETEQADIQEQGTLDFGDNEDEKGGEE